MNGPIRFTIKPLPFGGGYEVISQYGVGETYLGLYKTLPMAAERIRVVLGKLEKQDALIRLSGLEEEEK